jgi:hypothetical protein
MRSGVPGCLSEMVRKSDLGGNIFLKFPKFSIQIVPADFFWLAVLFRACRKGAESRMWKPFPEWKPKLHYIR